MLEGAQPGASNVPGRSFDENNSVARSPWFEKSKRFDPNLMNLSLLSHLQSQFRFVDNELVSFESQNQAITLRRYKELGNATDRQALKDLLCESDADFWDPRKRGIMRFSIGLSADNFDWLMEELEVHPLFLEALHSRVGQYGAFETCNAETDEPEYLHLIVKVPPCGHLEAAFYISYEICTGKMKVILAGNDFDTQAQHLAEHLQLAPRLLDPFAIALILIRRYHYFLHAQSIEVDHAVIMTERETGRGAVAYSDGQAQHTISPDKFDLTLMHWIEGNQRNIVYAAQFQSKLTAFLISEHLAHSKHTKGKRPAIASFETYHNLPSKAKSLHARYLLHQTAADSLHAASLVMRERIQRQLSAADSIINQYDNKVSISTAEASTNIAEQSRRIADESKKIAEEARRDSTSMKTIASLTMVYLPSTFAASIFSTGFFSFASADSGSLLLVNPQIWILFVVAIVLSVVTVATWI